MTAIDECSPRCPGSPRCELRSYFSYFKSREPVWVIAERPDPDGTKRLQGPNVPPRTFLDNESYVPLTPELLRAACTHLGTVTLDPYFALIWELNFRGQSIFGLHEALTRLYRAARAGEGGDYYTYTAAEDYTDERSSRLVKMAQWLERASVSAVAAPDELDPSSGDYAAEPAVECGAACEAVLSSGD